MCLDFVVSSSTGRRSSVHLHHSSSDLIHDTTSLSLVKVNGFNMVNQYRIEKMLGKGD